MRAQVQLEPQVLRDVIQERRREVAHDQHDDERLRRTSPRRRPHDTPSNPDSIEVTPFRDVLGPTERLYLPVLAAARPPSPAVRTRSHRASRCRANASSAGRHRALEDRVQSWRIPLRASELRGLRLLYDTPVPGGPTLAVVRSIVRSNHRLDPFDALVLATRAVGLAHDHNMDYGFFCATLLQESAFAPDAVSPAGAVGIAQFTLDTADDEGVDPFDWADAMRGSARLLPGATSTPTTARTPIRTPRRSPPITPARYGRVLSAAFRRIRNDRTTSPTSTIAGRASRATRRGCGAARRKSAP